MENSYYGRMNKEVPKKGFIYMAIDESLKKCIEKNMELCRKSVHDFREELRKNHKAEFKKINKALVEVKKEIESIKEDVDILNRIKFLKGWQNETKD